MHHAIHLLLYILQVPGTLAYCCTGWTPPVCTAVLELVETCLHEARLAKELSRGSTMTLHYHHTVVGHRALEDALIQGYPCT